MDFIGSKIKLNEWIFAEIERSAPPDQGWFVDAMCGSGAVSRCAAGKGYNVLACDLLSFPPHLARGSVIRDLNMSGTKMRAQAEALIAIMGGLPGVSGYFHKNFSPYSIKTGSEFERKYFSEDNAKKIDACRHFVGRIFDPKFELSEDFRPEILEMIRSTGWFLHTAFDDDERIKLRSILLYSLVEALSRVSNTAGTHGAYLKQFKERALAEFKPRLEPLFDGTCDAHQQDFIEFCKTKRYKDLDKSVVYVDPPYNERQYAPNYHLYEALIRYDGATCKGKTGLRGWTKDSKSGLCNNKGFLQFLDDLVENVSCEQVFISYSSDGLVPKEDIISHLTKKFPNISVDCLSQKYKRYKADSKRTYKDDTLYEYLFHLVIPAVDAV
jgi:adenine-specific DNA-methyltransferase